MKEQKITLIIGDTKFSGRLKGVRSIKKRTPMPDKLDTCNNCPNAYLKNMQLYCSLSNSKKALIPLENTDTYVQPFNCPLLNSENSEH